MKWARKLADWRAGQYPTFSGLKGSVVWRTSVYRDDTSVYQHECVSPGPRSSPDKDAFPLGTQGYVVDVRSPGGTALVCPVPKRSNDYSNLYAFTRTASVTQQRAFWKRVAAVVQRERDTHGAVWVSTHGFGVAWLHVRVSATPRYYGASRLSAPRLGPRIPARVSRKSVLASYPRTWAPWMETVFDGSRDPFRAGPLVVRWRQTPFHWGLDVAGDALSEPVTLTVWARDEPDPEGPAALRSALGTTWARTLAVLKAIKKKANQSR